MNLWGSKAGWVEDKGPLFAEMSDLRLDSSKAQSQLGWKPRLDLQTGLAWTVESYRDYIRKNDMVSSCNNQIEKYLSKEPT